MVVGRDRQFMATTRAAAPEDFAPIGGGHTLAETVHAQATADLGLICTFRHFNSSLKGIILLFNKCQTGIGCLAGKPCAGKAHDAAQNNKRSRSKA